MSTPNTRSSSQTISNQELEALKYEIEKKVNPKNFQESMILLTNPDKLINKMEEGSKLFKEKTGREPSYSEMREMYG